MAKNTFVRAGILGAAMTAVAAMPALAADVIYQEPPAPSPQPIVSMPVSMWSGPYAGVQLGYGFRGRTDDGFNEIGTSGMYGGAFGGFNLQNDMFVYGVEGDINYSGLSGSNAGVDSRTRIDGSLRVRAGVAVTDDILLYGTGGVAAERLRITDVGGARDTNLMVGYTVGAGVDAKLTDQVFGRVEYRYTDYGSKEFDFGGGNVRDFDSSNHRVGVGLGIKF